MSIDNALFWSNVAINIETARGAALTIDGIDKTNPAKVHATGTLPANGTKVVLSVAGMTELNGRVFEVINSGAGAFDLKGEDATAYRTFVSGTATPVTLGVSMTTVQNFNPGGGDPKFATLSVIHDSIERRAPTSYSPFTATMDMIFAPNDAAMKVLQTATRTKTKRVFEVLFSEGSKMLGEAYVAAPGLPSGQTQDTVTTKGSLEFQGMPTIVAA